MMSKALEALEIISNVELPNGTNQFDVRKIKDFKYLNEQIEIIKQVLIPPTEEEVCKALSEYINEPVWFDENNDIRISTQWVAKQLENYGLNFMCILPPKLAKMVAWFYEGKVRE